VVALSRPGFGEDRREAVLVVDYFCGPRCGAGHYVLLRRSAAGWRVIEAAPTWQS
jgi:hypothetical protein